MLSLQGSSSPSKVKATPNILPFRVGHTGPVGLPERYWNPQIDANEVAKGANPTKVAYFRGRRLLGKTIALDERYRGVVAEMTDQSSGNSAAVSRTQEDSQANDCSEPLEDIDEGSDLMEPKRLMQEVATFNEIVVWGHDALPGSDEPAVRSLQEWIGLAEAMHSYDHAESAAK